MQLPIYEVLLDSDDFEYGMQAVSFVDSPAIMVDFLAFKNDKPQEMYLQEDKHIVVSPILIPNQLIYRIDEQGQPYYIRWSEETIRKIAQKYINEQKQNNVTFEHPQVENPNLSYDEILLNDVYMLKMWIVEDVENDPINTMFGFNKLPNGTLCAMYKVHNRKLWQSIKNGEVKGLSIEAICNLQKVNFKKKDRIMTKDNLFEKIVAFLNDVSEDVKALEDVASKDEANSGVVELKYYIDDEHFLVVDGEGFVRDGETMFVTPQGEYKLADGSVLVVDEESKFIETRDMTIEAEDSDMVQAPIAEEKEEEEILPTEEEPKEEEKEDDEEIEDEVELADVEIDGTIYKVQKEVADYIHSILGEVSSKEEELHTYQRRVEEFESHTPSTSPIGTVIKQAQETKKESKIVTLEDAFNKWNRIKL